MGSGLWWLLPFFCERMGVLGWLDNIRRKKEGNSKSAQLPVSSVPQMRQDVSTVEKDAKGNYWYLRDFFGRSGKPRIDYNMASLLDKAMAMLACAPLYTVADKAGKMMSRGVPYVTDKDGNERRTYKDVKELLMRPNPLQTFSSFVRLIEINLKIFGFCPLALVRGYEMGAVTAMWVIPPELFHLQWAGNYFATDREEDLLTRAYVLWGGREVTLERWEYTVLYDGVMRMDEGLKEVVFDSVSDGLSQPVNNWIAAMSASHTLLVNGGPKGVLCSDYTDAMGNSEVTPEEEKEMRDAFKEEYGLVGKKYPVLVTRKKLSWIPMDFNADQLKLHDETRLCTEQICNAMGLNPNLFTDAKYDNQESAKKGAYQDVIIPDAKTIEETLTRAICPEGAQVKIDFSGVECLQANKKEEADTLVKAADALERLMNSGLITTDEARTEIARYIDIDPDNPKGQFKVQNGKLEVGNEDENEGEI